jgi:hypothetical protein
LPEVVYSGSFDKLGYVEFAWVRRVGHALIEWIELEIGGSQIDKQWSDWLNIWYELTHPVGQERGYAKMIGDVPELTELSRLSWDCPNQTILKPQYLMQIPLQFYFNRNNGLALPLIALQYHEVKINIHFRRLDELFISTDCFRNTPNDLELVDASLYVDYVYLDTEERRRYAQVSHEYLIEQLQHSGEESLTNNSAKYKLTFNHPSKALYWVTKLANYHGHFFMVWVPYQDQWVEALRTAAKNLILAQYDLDCFGFFNDVVLAPGEDSYVNDGKTYIAINPADPIYQPTYEFSTDAVEDSFEGSQRFIGILSESEPLLMKNKHCDLRTKVEGIVKIYADTDNNSDYFYPEVHEITRNDLTIVDLSIPIDKFDCDNRNGFIQAFDVRVWDRFNYGLLIDGTRNPVSAALLRLNGQDRFTIRPGSYFNYVQPWQCFTDTPSDGLNVYSFALEPVIHQPSGTLNFSRIDTAQLDLFYNEFANHPYADVFQDTDNKVFIYTVNYNVLRIMSGMGGLAYSN